MSGNEFFDLDDMKSSDGSDAKLEETLVEGINGPTEVVHVSNQLVALYEQFKKLVYVIDVSPSMEDGIVSGEYEKLYHWTDELVIQFSECMMRLVEEELKSEYGYLSRDSVKQKLQKQKALDLDEEKAGEDDDYSDETNPDDMEVSEEEIVEHVFNELWHCDQDDVHGIKFVVHDQKLATCFDIKLPPTGVKVEQRSKINTVKDASLKYLASRMDKYPEADVSVLEFDSKVYTVAQSPITKKMLLEIVNNLRTRHGGTDIYLAVESAVEFCKKYPSKMGNHQIVLVTDGQSYSAVNTIKLLPDMKSHGIVLDFILLSAGRGQYGSDEPIKVLQKVCNESGGEYTEVKTDADFTTKFLKASGRLCLPPATNIG